MRFSGTAAARRFESERRRNASRGGQQAARPKARSEPDASFGVPRPRKRSGPPRRPGAGRRPGDRGGPQPAGPGAPNPPDPPDPPDPPNPPNPLNPLNPPNRQDGRKCPGGSQHREPGAGGRGLQSRTEIPGPPFGDGSSRGAHRPPRAFVREGQPGSPRRRPGRPSAGFAARAGSRDSGPVRRRSLRPGRGSPVLRPVPGALPLGKPEGAQGSPDGHAWAYLSASGCIEEPTAAVTGDAVNRKS